MHQGHLIFPSKYLVEYEALNAQGRKGKVENMLDISWVEFFVKPIRINCSRILFFPFLVYFLFRDLLNIFNVFWKIKIQNFNYWKKKINSNPCKLINPGLEMFSITYKLGLIFMTSMKSLLVNHKQFFRHHSWILP